MDSKAAALADIDRALAGKPEVDGHVFSTAVHHLSALRDLLASKQRDREADAASRRTLEHVNAVISVVLAAHFPLGAIPWDELAKARGWLANIVEV